MATESPTKQVPNAWLNAGVNHPSCQMVRKIIREAIKGDKKLELVEGGDSFIVQGPENEQGTRLEAVFLFKACANPETSEAHMQWWVKRKLAKIRGEKIGKAPDMDKLNRKLSAKDGDSIEPTE